MVKKFEKKIFLLPFIQNSDFNMYHRFKKMENAF